MRFNFPFFITADLAFNYLPDQSTNVKEETSCTAYPALSTYHHHRRNIDLFAALPSVL